MLRGRAGANRSGWPNANKENSKCHKGNICGELGKKEQGQYEHIKESAEKSGRYGKRAAELAARTVKQQRKEKGPSKGK